MRIIAVLLLFAVQQLIGADDEQGEWKYPENCSSDYACDYRAQWWYLEKTDEIRFRISTKWRNKWTGIGFSNGQQMKGTDAVLGLVEDNGRYFLMDTYLSGYQAPPLDAVQNIHNMSVWRENGITHLQFHRFRTTSDPEYDFQFSDEHCPYLLFPVRGGVFNAVNKRMRKHEETPIVSKQRVCIRSNDANKRRKVINEVPPVRFNNNVPNKHKIPTRFKARPKLVNLVTTSAASTTTTPSSTASSTTSTSTPSSIDLKSAEPTTNTNLNRLTGNRRPGGTEQPVTSLPADLERASENANSNSKDKATEKLNDQTTSVKPTTFEVPKQSVASSTTQSSVPELSSVSINQKVSNSNSIETSNKSNEPKSEDKLEKLEYGDEDEEATSPIATESGGRKPVADDKEPADQDGRISADGHDETAPASRSTIKTFSFDVKILDRAADLNSTVVRREAEKELSDLTGFRQLKLIALRPLTETGDRQSGALNGYVADFEMQVQTPEPEANGTDYLAYLQNALNETVTSGHIGSLTLDTSHYALLKQDPSQTKPEAKYVFEYNFFNQLTVRLTKEQLRLAYIVLGVSLLVLLILMQACCMCCTSSQSRGDLHKQNNLSNSSTLQDKHQLNMHHHAQYGDYIKNCGNNYSYENFALDASDVNPSFNLSNSSYKTKEKHSLHKHDPMLYGNYANHSSSHSRRPDRPDFGYHYNNGNFAHHHNPHNYHRSSSHHRYFEPQPMLGLEQPDFYFMPKQRIKHHTCYN